MMINEKEVHIMGGVIAKSIMVIIKAMYNLKNIWYNS